MAFLMYKIFLNHNLQNTRKQEIRMFFKKRMYQIATSPLKADIRRLVKRVVLSVFTSISWESVCLSPLPTVMVKSEHSPWLPWGGCVHLFHIMNYTGHLSTAYLQLLTPGTWETISHYRNAFRNKSPGTLLYFRKCFCRHGRYEVEKEVIKWKGYRWKKSEEKKQLSPGNSRR